jgi:hypothetical protein
VIIGIKEGDIPPLNASLFQEQKQSILDFMLGAVVCWCKNHTTQAGEQQEFGVRELFGTSNDNRVWTATPLIALWQWHEANSNHDTDEAMKNAAMDAGSLLMHVLYHARWTFERLDVHPRKYIRREQDEKTARKIDELLGQLVHAATPEAREAIEREISDLLLQSQS